MVHDLLLVRPGNITQICAVYLEMRALVQHSLQKRFERTAILSWKGLLTRYCARSRSLTRYLDLLIISPKILQTILSTPSKVSSRHKWHIFLLSQEVLCFKHRSTRSLKLSLRTALYAAQRDVLKFAIPVYVWGWVARVSERWRSLLRCAPSGFDAEPTGHASLSVVMNIQQERQLFDTYFCENAKGCGRFSAACVLSRYRFTGWTHPFNLLFSILLCIS